MAKEITLAQLQTMAERSGLKLTDEEVEKLLAEREPLYRQVMTAELDVTRLTPEEAVVYIARLI